MKRFPALLLIAASAWGQKPPAPLPAGLYATFNTSEGTITAVLYEKYTPESVRNFVGLAQGTKAWRDPATGAMVKRPMYDNLVFHRVLRGQMIQSGDPTGVGNHNCGFTIHDEFMLGMRFDHSGRLAVANTGAPDSGACQFFITADLVPEWNDKYTIFGQVVRGLDVVEAISRAPLHGDKPVNPAKLLNVTIFRVMPKGR